MERANQTIYDRIRYCEVMTIQEIAFTFLHNEQTKLFTQRLFREVEDRFHRGRNTESERGGSKNCSSAFRFICSKNIIVGNDWCAGYSSIRQVLSANSR